MNEKITIEDAAGRLREKLSSPNVVAVQALNTKIKVTIKTSTPVKEVDEIVRTYEGYRVTVGTIQA